MLALLFRFIAALTGLSVEAVDAVGVPLSGVVGLLISIAITDVVLRKRFREFTIAFLSASNQQVEHLVTWGRTISIWWCWMWRSTVALLVAVSLAIPLAGLGIPAPIAGLLANLLVLPIVLVIFRSVLRKRYRGFTIKLIPTGANGRT